MKKKWVFFFIASFVVAQFTLMASFADTTGLREEASALENIYQQKAKTTLNTLLNPEDYTIVVSATIRNDEEKIKQYHDDVARRLLPGLNMDDPLGIADGNNILNDLKQKVEVQVIMAENAPADRDNLVKEVLKSKLKLNEENGDTITIARAVRAPASTDKAPPETMAELSGRMIIFWIILAVLSLAGLALWLWKRHERKKAKDEEEAENLEKAAEAAAAEENQDEEAQKEEIQKTPEELERERDALEMKLAFSKGELVKLIKEYSSIVCKAAEEFIAQGHIQQATTFLEALGWDQSRKLFKDLDARLWGRVGAALREREDDPNLEQIFSAVHVFHRFALSFVLERAGRDTENPFTFIFQLTDSQRLDLLEHEKPYNIALIAIYCSGPQMGELLDGLDPLKQNEVLLNITKIKHLPETEIRESVDALLMRLERIKADPSIHVNGAILASDFMRSLSPAREEELYQSLVTQHPDEAEKLRRIRVMFQDIPYYPVEMVRRIVENIDSEEILRALVGLPSDFVESFLALLPTKKALMIQNDLYHMVDTPTPSQCAENRRKITSKVEIEFETQRFNIAEYWKAFDQPQETAPAETEGFAGDGSEEVVAVSGLEENQYSDAQPAEDSGSGEGNEGDNDGSGNQAA